MPRKNPVPLDPNSQTPHLDRLAEQQQLFVREYVARGARHGAGDEAAIAAGYSPRSAAVTASRMLQRDDIKAAVQELLAPRFAALGIDADQVLEQVAAIATFDLTEVVEVEKSGKVTIKPTREWPRAARLAVSEVRKGKDGLSIKMHPKLPALEFLGRHLDVRGAVQRMELSGRDGGPVEVEHRGPDFADIIKAFKATGTEIGES